MYNAITIAAPVVIAVLSDKRLGDFISCIKTGLGLVDLHRALQAKQAIPDDPGFAVLRDVVTTLHGELAKAGLSEEQCATITYRVLDELLKDPAGARRFVGELAGTRH